MTIAALRTGDPAIFEEIYRAWHERVYFYVLGKTGSEWLAEETTQMTFIRLWRSRDKLSDEIEFGIQLFRIARTAMIDEIRKEHRKQRDRNLDTPAAHDGNSQQDGRELEQRIAVLIDSMPPVRRQVFRMSRFSGLSYQEIASELSLSVKTVEAHVSKALQYLRRMTVFLSFLFFLK